MEILDGVTPRQFEGRSGEDAMWERLYDTEEFFYSLEPMPDMEALVRGVEALGFTPTVLTGVPQPRAHQKSSVSSGEQKRKWVAKYLGPQYEVITCRSKDKCLYIEAPGDVLIDDWHRYRHLWEGANGKFILHTDALQSLTDLDQYVYLRGLK